jgi:PAT family beta-lactamase induction signal transducer AmpG
MITGQGLLIILAGYFEVSTGLPSEKITFVSTPNDKIVQEIILDSVAVKPIDGDLRIISSQTSVQIATNKITVEKFDSIKTAVLAHNSKAGFYSVETAATAEQKNHGIWHDYIVNPLEHFIRKYFGPTKQIVIDKKVAGNYGLIYFHLSKNLIQMKIL